MDRDMFIIGNLVRTRRLELGMTMEELAKEAGYSSYTAISKIENGSRNVKMSKLPDLANALKVDMAYFFSDLEEEKEELSAQDKELLIEFQKLNDTNKSAAINYIKFLNQNTKEE